MLPAAERAAFIGKHLMAQHRGTRPPQAVRRGEPQPIDLMELKQLENTLTDAINSTRSRDGWPLRAVAEYLGGSDSTELQRPFPLWWPAAASSISRLPARETQSASGDRQIKTRLTPSSLPIDDGVPAWWQDGAVSLVKLVAANSLTCSTAPTSIGDNGSSSAPEVLPRVVEVDSISPRVNAKLPSWWNAALGDSRA